MEWSAILPEDRRTLRSLLNLDENGLPCGALPTEEHAVAAAQSTLASETPEHHDTTVTMSELKYGIQEQVSLVYFHWTAVRRLTQRYRQAPQLRSCQVVKVQQILDGTFFKDFMVVYAEIQIDIAFRASRTKRGRETCSEITTVGSNHVVVPETMVVDGSWEVHTQRFHTMHFVHRFRPGVGYEVQSVSVPDRPLELQCVAGNMLQFVFLTFMRANYGMPPPAKSGWDASRLQLPQHGSVVILGMGGNVMGNCLVRLLPPTVPIHVVEIEPSVVAVCMLEGLVPTAENFKTHVCDVSVALSGLDDGSCSIIVLDCFDPLEGEMEHGRTLLQLAKSKLLQSPSEANSSRHDDRCSTGLLLVNVHQRPTQASLQLFFDIFGTHCVEAVDLYDARQCFVACCLHQIPTLSATQLEQFSETAAKHLLATHGFELPLPLSVKGARGIASKNVDEHDPSKPFRVWRSEKDTI